MKREIHYTALGGTLFVPASHKNLEAIISGVKYPELKSVVIDFEDGLEDAAFEDAMLSLENALQKTTQNSPFLFIRAKNSTHLEELLGCDVIECLDGFVLAKFSLSNAQKYLTLLENREFYIMPSIEGAELFSHEKLHKLKEQLVPNKHKVLLVRFGLEDMLRQLSMRRSCRESIFDFTATASVVGNFIATFKSAGFGVSGGVYPCFEDAEGFRKDVKRDLHEGLFSKTIIHPEQIAPLNELYRVSQEEYDAALEIVRSHKKVFNQKGKMAETLTMKNYAELIIKRAEIYGIIRISWDR